MNAPQVVDDRPGLAAARAALPGRVAAVMTMGALHDGHAALMRAAREHADSVVVTIFVNPLQFGAGEDLDRYPRTFDRDLQLCAAEGVELVFAPTPEVVYPSGTPGVQVRAGALGGQWEGAHRPGHFDGVLTVVAKLLHLVRPDVAMFGEKDAQQLALVRAMVRDLDFGVRVVGVPTVREEGGLARSSRNAYLSDRDRTAARSLNRALAAGAGAATAGPAAVVAAARAVLEREPEVAVDYVALVDDETWADAGDGTSRARLLVAGRVGATRLIDNVQVDLGTRAG